jgi:aryl-alcohol dehydrogenase-like predicted oxidoreductase
MEYGKLGNTDIEVSKLCVGCMSFGKARTMHDWTLDEADIFEIIPENMYTADDLNYNDDNCRANQ